MKRNFIKLLMVSLISLGAFVTVVPEKVSAQNLICNIFPFLQSFDGLGLSTICGQGTGTEAVNAGANFIRFGLQLVFVGIIIVAIYIIIKAAVKYIQSEGDDTKIQEAQKAIKSVFIGIASLFVGIIGIVIVLAFFSATGAVNENISNPGTGTIIDDFFNTLLNGGGDTTTE